MLALIRAIHVELKAAYGSPRMVSAIVADQPKTGALAFELTDAEAWNLAQFLRRVRFSDFRGNTQDDQETYAMPDATDRVRVSLAEARHLPR